MLLDTSPATSDELRSDEELPVMVDSKTKLDDILLKDITVIYTCQLKHIDKAQALEFKNKNKELNEPNPRKEEQIQRHLKKDFDVKFTYKIKRDTILEVNVNKDFSPSPGENLNCASKLV